MARAMSPAVPAQAAGSSKRNARNPLMAYSLQPPALLHRQQSPIQSEHSLEVEFQHDLYGGRVRGQVPLQRYGRAVRLVPGGLRVQVTRLGLGYEARIQQICRGQRVPHISRGLRVREKPGIAPAEVLAEQVCDGRTGRRKPVPDRKSTRLNSSHLGIS